MKQLLEMKPKTDPLHHVPWPSYTENTPENIRQTETYVYHDEDKFNRNRELLNTFDKCIIKMRIRQSKREIKQSNVKWLIFHIIETLFAAAMVYAYFAFFLLK